MLLICRQRRLHKDLHLPVFIFSPPSTLLLAISFRLGTALVPATMLPVLSIIVLSLVLALVAFVFCNLGLPLGHPPDAASNGPPTSVLLL